MLGGFATGCIVAFSIKIAGDWLSRDSSASRRRARRATVIWRRPPCAACRGMIFATAVDAIGDGLLLGPHVSGEDCARAPSSLRHFPLRWDRFGISVAERMSRGGVSARKGIGVALALSDPDRCWRSFGALVPADDLAAPMAFGTAVLPSG